MDISLSRLKSGFESRYRYQNLLFDSRGAVRISGHGDGLRRDLGMGVSGVEAVVLSGEAGLGKVSRILREPLEFDRSELHVPAFSHGEVAGGLGGRHACRIQVCDQGAPIDHAHQAPEGSGGLNGEIHCGPANRCTTPTSWGPCCFSFRHS